MNKELILEVCRKVIKSNGVTGVDSVCEGIVCSDCPFSRINNNSKFCGTDTKENYIAIAKKYIAENTEFDWEEFKSGSIAVLLDTKEKIDDFLKECDKQNVRWGTAKASENMPISREGISENCYCCYRMYSVLEYCHKAWYESEGKTIVKWNIKEEKVVDNKFKVGDKVRCIDDSDGNLCITKGEVYEVEMVHNNWLNVKYNDFHCADYQSFRFELVEEKKTEKTFKEVIADIKEGEVWESNSIAYDIKTIEMYNGSIEIKRRNMDNEIFIRKETLFKLQRKQYNFTEAFAAYEEGKEIESTYTGTKFIKNEFKTNDVYSNWRLGVSFKPAEIKNKWYINN